MGRSKPRHIASVASTIPRPLLAPPGNASGPGLFPLTDVWLTLSRPEDFGKKLFQSVRKT
jgi:hypothetical protein